MSLAAKGIWLLGGLALLCFAGLVYISKTQIEPAGFVIFDSLLLGYDGGDARALLRAMSPAQMATYLGAFRTLDTVFPPLLMLTLWGIIWQHTKAEPTYMRIGALLGPLLYLVFDLMENRSVAEILVAWPVVVDVDVAQAAIYTQAKWMCLALGFLVALWAWRFAAKEPAI